VKEKCMGLLPVALVQNAEDNVGGKICWKSTATRPNRWKYIIKNDLARDRL
jgi:hypothetical protein